MDIYICDACGDRGELTPTLAAEQEICLLAESDTGNLLCLPCFMQEKSTCLHCLASGEIFPDTSCKGEPWLCRECLDLPYRIHMFSCYLDGCMTPEEYTQMAYREIQYEEEERKENSHGSNPW